LAEMGVEAWKRIVEDFSNEDNLKAMLEFMRARLVDLQALK